MSSSILGAVPLAPRDPILGVTEAYNADPNPRKVNLGVGVYYDDDGKVPVLECVRRAERALAEAAAARSYLPIDGMPAYVRAVQELVFGRDAGVLREGRVATIQALGGTGALKEAADLLYRVEPGAEVWISDPSWENHRALFENAGFKVQAYPYYDAATHGLDFAGMTRTLERLPSGAVVVLHVCCHNPTGVDLAPEQWERVIEIVGARGLVPVLDMAYQGFANDLTTDSAPVRRFAERVTPVFVSNSFSKTFSLYGERVGALSVVTASRDETARVLSQLKRLVRTNYSNPPTHGGQIVATVLSDPELRALWERELAQMRERIKAMRRALVEKVQAQAPGVDLGFVLRQNGMFSYSGLSKEAVAKLREEYSIYAIESGRICVAALNSHNIDYVAGAIAKVMRETG
ncbi:MAG TPA: amino acid aminotransferase [Burkholderiales bacterium]